MQNSREFAQGGHRPPIPLDLRAEIRKLKADLSALSNTVKQLGGTMATREKRIEHIPFSRVLTRAGTVGSGASIVEQAPFNCYVNEVVIHWPNGCNALVDVAVFHNVARILPREGFLALNDVTRSWRLNTSVDGQEELRVEMRNGDGAWPHTITVTIEVEER